MIRHESAYSNRNFGRKLNWIIILSFDCLHNYRDPGRICMSLHTIECCNTWHLKAKKLLISSRANGDLTFF